MPPDIDPALSADRYGLANEWSSADTPDTQVLGHPRFDEAMVVAARSFVGFYRGNWVLNRIANDRGRVITSFIMLDLHFSNGMTGFTVAQLREEARHRNICSPNRMTALAALLQVGGFLKAVPSKDSRMRRLAPTEAMLTLHRERLAGAIAANVLINPDLAAVLPLLGQNQILGDIARSYLSYWRSGQRATGNDPALEAFIERDAAFTILFLLLTGLAEGRAYRISDFARHFAISRAHALSIMRAGMDFGLIAQNGPNGPYLGQPKLLETMRPFFLALFQIQADAVRHALRQHALRRVIAP
ncbi:hypothetical protein ACELLULO517_24815 [Acidisoma cellulosilytica]|uniref:Uncharacterized protein n=1 Tax=Acidisoma cellulosilyticum TaxID=2802395 RepID=A0A963Z6M0_9PROT|nr:hypothetical protein [Acidisoma cellulosilyticum]MCB8883494.1 hypothetical protein [Acidisoma cellulosilyticum]